MAHIQVKELDQPTRELLEKVLVVIHRAFADSSENLLFLEIFQNFGRLFVAFDYEKPVGVAQVLRSWGHPSAALIASIAIDPEYQRRGIGTKLVSFVIDQLKTNGLARLEVHVAPWNWGALEVFKKNLGFLENANLQDFYGLGEHRIHLLKEL